jgi:ferredoxin-NADP reductase
MAETDACRPPGPGPWQLATVDEVRIETPTSKTFVLKLDTPPTFWAGQHYLVRLTAPDGYRAQRSYSVASPPGCQELALTVELLPGGEVSGFLHEFVEPGDELEIRGPIGGHFAWDGRPAVGVAGGSGVVPLMSMLRHARSLPTPGLFRLLVSVRTPKELFYADELPSHDARIICTRCTSPWDGRPAGRLDKDDLVPLLDARRDVYVCGSTGFCDAATRLITEVGVPVDRVKVERFGFSG